MAANQYLCIKCSSSNTKKCKKVDLIGNPLILCNDYKTTFYSVIRMDLSSVFKQ